MSSDSVASLKYGHLRTTNMCEEGCVSGRKGCGGGGAWGARDVGEGCMGGKGCRGGEHGEQGMWGRGCMGGKGCRGGGAWGARDVVEGVHGGQGNVGHV